MARVLVAPDKFQGSLTAVEVAEVVRRGLLAAAGDPDRHDIRCLPVDDGGDGTLEAEVSGLGERPRPHRANPVRGRAAPPVFRR